MSVNLYADPYPVVGIEMDDPNEGDPSSLRDLQGLWIDDDLCSVSYVRIAAASGADILMTFAIPARHIHDRFEPITEDNSHYDFDDLGGIPFVELHWSGEPIVGQLLGCRINGKVRAIHGPRWITSARDETLVEITTAIKGFK